VDENGLKCEHLRKLKEFEIDPTEYLLALLRKPNKRVQIVKNDDSANFSNIHFHE
jgi:hypothetical protein